MAELFLLDCHNYNDYLDRFSTKGDRCYLSNINAQRMLVTLNYRAQTKIYTKEEFFERKKVLLKNLLPDKTGSFEHGARLTISKDPVLQELAIRERANLSKLISTIIFLCTHNKRGMEISGFIDFEESIRRWNEKQKNALNWSAIFEDKAVLRPKTTDLSYFDWHTGRVYYNDSSNYIVRHNVDFLTFLYRGDHKRLCINKEAMNLAFFRRKIVFSEKYGYVAFYDHVVRKKF